MGKINWYALYVRMHHEKRTAERLAQMEVEYYLPVQEVVASGVTGKRNCRW